MQIYKAELPNLSDLYDHGMTIQNLKGTDKEALEDEKDYFMTSGQTLIHDYEDYVKEEIYGSDPAKATMELENYDMIAGGIAGLGQALHHKYRAGIYEQLTVESNGTDNKKKLAQGDRGEYAKGRSAGIEGCLQMVEGIHKNIQERLNNFKGKRSRY